MYNIKELGLFIGKENKQTADHMEAMKEDGRCIIIGYGQSMTPILENAQPVICEPVRENTELNKNDIVFCKVNGHYMVHKINAIKNNKRYQIANNHGHVNGWISKKNIFGKVVEICK